MSFTKLGNSTKRVRIYKSESYKLHQAFPVADAEVIKEGYPVGLNAEGKLFHYKGIGTYLGIAVTGTAAYPQNNEITVMVQGFVIVHGVSAAALEAGYVKPGDAATDVDFVKYSQSTVTAGEPAVTSPLESNFIALDVATAAGQVIPILVR